MNALRLLGWIWIVIGGVGLAASLLICVGILLFAFDPRAGAALGFFGPLSIMLSVVYFIPGLIGGWGLLRANGWSRMIIAIVSLFVLFLFPIGTALAAFSYWAIFSKPVEPGGPSRLVIALIVVAIFLTIALGAYLSPMNLTTHVLIKE
ncbi:MAG: hypothetical protein AB7O04_10580 [Hyphomonadaceae bacterium]